MSTFARAITRSWVSRLWTTSPELTNKDNLEIETQANQVNTKLVEQNRRFLDASKDGGIWFS